MHNIHNRNSSPLPLNLLGPRIQGRSDLLIEYFDSFFIVLSFDLPSWADFDICDDYHQCFFMFPPPNIDFTFALCVTTFYVSVCCFFMLDDVYCLSHRRNRKALHFSGFDYTRLLCVRAEKRVNRNPKSGPLCVWIVSKVCAQNFQNILFFDFALSSLSNARFS